jgi:hypothetical protein
MIVKLGTCFPSNATEPLLRTNAVRRDVSPSAGSTMNVVMYHEPSANSETGPRSTVCRFCPRNGEAGDGHGHDAADDGAEAERRRLEELAAREPLARRGRRHRVPADGRGQRRRVAGVRLAHLPMLGLDDDRLSAELGRGVARPEEPEDDRDRGADRPDDRRGDDEAHETDDDADREPDRPQARRREMLLVVVL